MASRVAIVFCGDRNGALPMTVALRSVARHSSRPVDYSVVTADMDQEQREKLASCVNRAGGDTIRFVDPGQTFAGFPPGPNNSHANYYRIVLPEVLQDVSRALYFDADLLVRVDVAELWDRVVSSTAPVQACQDASPSYICDATLPVYAEYGLQLGAPYYNAGVLGLDLDVLRREKLTNRCWPLSRGMGRNAPTMNRERSMRCLARASTACPGLGTVSPSSRRPTRRLCTTARGESRLCGRGCDWKGRIGCTPRGTSRWQTISTIGNIFPCSMRRPMHDGGPIRLQLS